MSLLANDNSAFKVVFLAIEAASKRWTMSIRNWPQAMNQFIILHEDLYASYDCIYSSLFNYS
jgi:transposase-like protein